MKIPELRKTVRTFTDEELTQMLRIAHWSENKTKGRIIEKEIGRRYGARKDGSYKDETLKPSISLQDRLSTDR